MLTNSSAYCSVEFGSSTLSSAGPLLSQPMLAKRISSRDRCVCPQRRRRHSLRCQHWTIDIRKDAVHDVNSSGLQFRERSGLADLVEPTLAQGMPGRGWPKRCHHRRRSSSRAQYSPVFQNGPPPAILITACTSFGTPFRASNPGGRAPLGEAALRSRQDVNVTLARESVPRGEYDRPSGSC